jgi:hypothetical protein
MGSVGPRTKNDCADKDQQQSNRNELGDSNLVPPECKRHTDWAADDTAQRCRIECVSKLQQRDPLPAVHHDP